MGMDPHLATGRQKHHETPVPAEAAAPSAEAAAPSARSERQGKDAAQTAYGDGQSSVRGAQAHRRAGIRPDQSRAGIRKFLLRGLEKVSAEWQLICLTHNLLKIWRQSFSVGVIEGDSEHQGGRGRKGQSPAKSRGDARARDSTRGTCS